MHLSYGLVPHLSKILSKLQLSIQDADHCSLALQLINIITLINNLHFFFQISHVTIFLMNRNEKINLYKVFTIKILFSFNTYLKPILGANLAQN